MVVCMVVCKYRTITVQPVAQKQQYVAVHTNARSRSASFTFIACSLTE